MRQSFVSQMEEEAEKQEASPLPTERQLPMSGDITMVGHKTSLGVTNGEYLLPSKLSALTYS